MSLYHERVFSCLITRRLLLAALVLGVSGWNFAWGQAAVPGRDRPARMGRKAHPRENVR